MHFQCIEFLVSSNNPLSLNAVTKLSKLRSSSVLSREFHSIKQKAGTRRPLDLSWHVAYALLYRRVFFSLRSAEQGVLRPRVSEWVSTAARPQIVTLCHDSTGAKEREEEHREEESLAADLRPVKALSSCCGITSTTSANNLHTISQTPGTFRQATPVHSAIASGNALAESRVKHTDFY